MMSVVPPHSYAGHDLEALSGLDNYYGWILDTFRPYIGRRVIEVGAGLGEISQRLIPLASELHLVEPAPELAPRLRERFAGQPGLTVFESSLESHFGKCAALHWDTAILVNVLEHIEDDDQALRDIFRVLRPGGALCLYVPALPLLFSRFDRDIGHYRRYRRSALARQLTAAGFRVVLVAYRDALGVLPWFLLHTLGGSRRINPTLAGIYDRLFVPVVRRAEEAFPLPFGKSLIAIASKP